MHALLQSVLIDSSFRTDATESAHWSLSAHTFYVLCLPEQSVSVVQGCSELRERGARTNTTLLERQLPWQQCIAQEVSTAQSFCGLQHKNSEHKSSKLFTLPRYVCGDGVCVCGWVGVCLHHTFVLNIPEDSNNSILYTSIVYYLSCLLCAERHCQLALLRSVGRVCFSDKLQRADNHLALNSQRPSNTGPLHIWVRQGHSIRVPYHGMLS